MPPFRRLFLAASILAACVLGGAPNAAAAAAPVFSSYTVMGISSMTVSWTGTDGYQAIISTGVFPSTDNFFSGNQYSASGLTGSGLSWTFSGLSTNATYYVAIVDSLYNYTSFTATSTLADVPLANGPLTAGGSQMLVPWSTTTNPSSTLFDCQISTAPDFSFLSDENIVTGAQTSFFGLTPNTLYYVQVRAINNNGIPTIFTALNQTYTTVNSPGSGFASVGANSATTIWNSNGNPAGTFYDAVVSSDNSPTSVLAITSTTANLYATFSGLLPNTLYNSWVRARGSNGNGNSAYAALGSTITLANPPISIGASTLTGPAGPAISASWQLNGNPVGTTYYVEINVSPSFLPVTGYYVTSPSIQINGLSAFTTYYLEVQAVNSGGTPTAFVSLPTTETLSSPPGVLSYSNVSASQLQANWRPDGTASPNTYTAVLSSGALPNGFAGNQSASTTNLFEAFTGLAPNATYFVEVSSTVGGLYAQLGSTITLAVAPGGAITAISSHSITASWPTGPSNADPAGTSYLLQASTDADFDTIISSIGTTSTAGTVQGLTALTTYYVELEAISFAGVESGFTSLGSTFTWPNLGPAVPVLSSSTLGTSSVTWTWSALPLASGYRFLNSAGASLYGDLGAGVVSLTETNLSTNTSYTRLLAAFNGVGVSTSAALTAVTYADAPTASSVTVVGISSVAISWTALDDPSPRTEYVAEIWQQTGATTTATTASTSLAFNVLPGATYYLDVYAQNLAGVATTHTVSVSTFLPLINMSSTTVYPDTGGTLFAYTANGPITIYFPPATFPVTVAASLNGVFTMPHALSDAAQLTATQVGADIEIVPPMQPNEPVSLTLGYQRAQMAAYNAAALAIAYYDPAQNLWVPLPSVSNPSLNQVTGQSHHLSTFQIMAVTPATDLGSATVFPNPFRPALGHTVITFSNLPADSRVRVYTILGELVADLSADATGMAHWNATNRGGQSVASGGYFALVQGAGDKKILKVMIQR